MTAISCRYVMARAASAVLLASLCAGTPAYGGLPAGVYTNQCYVSEADDYGGMIVTLSYENRRPQVKFEVCEGVCSLRAVRNVSVVGNKLTFSAQEYDDKFIPYVGTLRSGFLELMTPKYLDRDIERLKETTGHETEADFDRLGPGWFNCQGSQRSIKR